LLEIVSLFLQGFLQGKSEHQFMNMKARVKMNTKAQLEEEMDLHVGDIVTVTEIVDKDWYRYVTVSGFGMFEFHTAVFFTLDYLLHGARSFLRS